MDALEIRESREISSLSLRQSVSYPDGSVRMKGFDFEEERIKQEITKQSARRVLLQFPEGLKPEGPRLAVIVEKTGALPIVSADQCYGACDLAIDQASRLGVDLIIHFGHARMVKHAPIPTVYVEARATLAV